MGSLQLSLVCECMVLAECEQERVSDDHKHEFDDLLKKIKWPIRDKLRGYALTVIFGIYNIKIQLQLITRVYDEIEKRVRENQSNKKLYSFTDI